MGRGLKSVLLDEPLSMGDLRTRKSHFRILSVRSQSCLRLQSYDSEFKTKIPLALYEIDGTISGYDIHPSGDYIIVTSE